MFLAPGTGGIWCCVHLAGARHWEGGRLAECGNITHCFVSLWRHAATICRRVCGEEAPMKPIACHTYVRFYRISDAFGRQTRFPGDLKPDLFLF